VEQNEEPEAEVIPEPTPVAQEPVEPIPTSIVHKPSPPTPKRSSWSFEKFLVAAGLASVIATIVLLLANQKKLTWPWAPNTAPSSSPKTSQLSGSDAEFVNYMRRSLDALDNKSKAKQKTTTASTLSTTNSPSSPVPASGNLSPAPNQPPMGFQRFSFPVYPPQTQGSSVKGAIPQALRPQMSALPPIVPAPVPALPQSAKPSPSVSVQAQSISIKPQVPALPQSAKPSPSAVAPKAKPSAPPIPQTVAAAPPPSTASESPQTPQSSASVVQHTLMGLMDSTEFPAALFEVNGVTKRFKVGEAIGSSGWTLVSVNNGEAMIRRNGEVRSIYPGQKF
jgi:hypothetical protein